MTPRIRRPKPSLSPRYRLLIAATGFVLWSSGVGWLVFHYFVRTKGEFGPTQSSFEPWWLKLHGAAAFLTLFTLGLLWGVHVLKGWTSRKRRLSGGSLLALLVALTISGYLLYYVGGDELRAAVALAHWIPGLALPLIYLIHRAKAARARKTPHLRNRPEARRARPEQHLDGGAKPMDRAVGEQNPVLSGLKSPTSPQWPHLKDCSPEYARKNTR